MFYKNTDTYSNLRVQFLLIGLSLRTLIQHHKFLYFERNHRLYDYMIVIWLLVALIEFWSMYTAAIYWSRNDGVRKQMGPV